MLGLSGSICASERLVYVRRGGPRADREPGSTARVAETVAALMCLRTGRTFAPDFTRRVGCYRGPTAECSSIAVLHIPAAGPFPRRRPFVVVGDRFSVARWTSTPDSHRVAAQLRAGARTQPVTRPFHATRRFTLPVVPGPAPALERVEHEISVALRDHYDELVHRIAVALVEIAVKERAAKNGTGEVNAPKVCAICRARLAAHHRTICHACRGRERRERERLRQAHAAELAAISNGARGQRAAELVLGERVDPALEFQ
jgi:hypothetical protein